jgi:hypothetical protein
MKNSKYPRALARIETTSRRQYDLEKIKAIDSKDTVLLQKKGAFTFANAYPFIFDGLSFLCTNHATDQWTDSDGNTRDVIERQDNRTETHYKAGLKLKTFMDMALNGHNEHRRDFLRQLYKLVAHPEKKVLPYTDGCNIITEPVRIDFILEDETKLSENEEKRLSNLCNKREKGKKIRGKIKFIIIEFYKPLFESLFLVNSKGKLGKNYIQVPKALHAEIKATVAEIVTTEFFKGTDLEKENVPLYESNVRAVFLYFALHDNRKGDYITINALDFAESCFPKTVKIIYKEQTDIESGRTYKASKKYLSRANCFKIRAKIIKTITTLKQMGKRGKMDGGQFIPVGLDETKVQYSYKSHEFRIKVLRPKNTDFPEFNPNDIRP